MTGHELYENFLQKITAVGFAANDAELIKQAFRDARFLHEGQYRGVPGKPGSSPYIDHPLRVATRVIDWGIKDAQIIIAALLHDTVEDCADKILRELVSQEAVEAAEADQGQSNRSQGESGKAEGGSTTAGRALGEAAKIGLALDWVENAYGSEVRDLVDTVTNRGEVSYGDKIDHILTNGAVGAVIVKASDLVDNAGSLHEQAASFGPEKLARLTQKYGPQVKKFVSAFSDDARLEQYEKTAVALTKTAAALANTAEAL